MCLGDVATVVDLVDPAHAVVRLTDGRTGSVSLAVLVADGATVEPGDRVVVSIGMALRLVHDGEEVRP
jgi:hydrogenase maturation factor